MKGLFIAAVTTFAALFLIALPSESQAQERPANGRFYCQGVFNFDMRLDVDFFGNSADLEFYNARTGEWTRRYGNFDDFRSTFTTTHYRVSPMASIQFPANYKALHWFQLTYSDSYGWIRFDCNHF